MTIGLLCGVCWKSNSNLNAKQCKCGEKYPRQRKYRVRIKTPVGWKTRTAGSLSEAQHLESEFKRITDDRQEDTQLPEDQPPSLSPALSEIWPLYLDWAKVNKKSWDMDFSRYKNHLKKPLSHFPMESIKPFHVQKILTRMQNRKYKPATVKQVLMLIKRIYSWSIEQDLYTGPNPCDRIKPPKFDNKVTASLSKEGLESLMRILEDWPNERVVLPIKFALYSGKRKCEILSLKWSDVDLENGFITLQDTKGGVKQSLQVNRHCMVLLSRAKEIRICDHVFPSRNGNGYLGGGFDRIWRRIR